MIGVATSPFNLSMLRKANVWYSVKDGNWSDPAVWISNGSKKHIYPQSGDDVIINHNVGFDVINTSVSNLYINGYLSITAPVASTINVFGHLQTTGTLDLSFHNLNHIVNLYGDNNTVANFIAGFSTINYCSPFDQFIMPITYYNMLIANLGSQQINLSNRVMATKYITSDFTALGDVTISDFSTLECMGYNVTTRSLIINSNAPACLSVKGAGTLIINGQFNITALNSKLDLSGNPTLELRGGLNCKSDSTYNWGTGAINFTTNNQNITGDNNLSSYNVTIPNQITIVGNITITNLSAGIKFDGVINGTTSGSTLNNNTTLILGSTFLPMNTGVFNYNNNSASVIGYAFNGDYILPYTNYAGLFIDGTGIKTPLLTATFTSLSIGNIRVGSQFNLSASITLAGNLSIYSGKLECSAFDLSVGGTTHIFSNNASTSILSKTGSGNLLFVGALSISNQLCGTSLIGNPSIEFRSGLTMKRDGTYNWGSGNMNFTINNQTISALDAVDDFHTTLANNITIAGGITLNISCPLWIFTGTINGASSSSILVNQSIIRYQNPQQPMQTGVLQCNSVANTFIYNLAGNQDITPSIYRNLTLAGSGAKKLLGNVSVVNAYTLTAPATLNSNEFALTNP